MRRVISTLVLNVCFYPSFLVGSAVVIPVLGLCMVVQAPFITHRVALQRFRALIKVYGRFVLRLAYPFVRVAYEDRGVAGDGACIYICNHRSASDPFLMSLLPGEIVQVVNTWPFRLPVLGILARWAGYLSIREMPLEAFYERAETLLRQGVSLVVFPEGTRSASRTMGAFHGAAFRLALRSAIPLVPVCLTGNEAIPRKGSLRLSPGRITVRRLPALLPAEFRGMSPFKLKNRVRDTIAREAAEMEAFA